MGNVKNFLTRQNGVLQKGWYPMLKVIFLCSMVFIGQIYAAQNITNKQGEQMLSNYKVIDTNQLVDLKKKIPNLMIVDSRTKQYDDGKRIPGAIYLPADASEAEISAALPKKDQPIVIYCWSEQCPASTWLVDHLIKMGYTNLYKYSEGLYIWINQGLPIEATR